MSKFSRVLATGAAVARAALDGRYREALAIQMRHYLEQATFLGDLDGRAVESLAAAAPSDTDLCGGLLVTTSAGLFILAEGQWHRLVKTPGYGVALDGDGSIYVVASPASDSIIVKGRLEGRSAKTRLVDAKPLCRFATRYHGDRLHQVVWDPFRQALLCANTRRNSILIVDPETGSFRDEIFLFADTFGHSFWVDVNHINGVAPHPAAILFSAHTMGAGGGLGFVTPERVCAFAYQGRGLHDILIHDGSVMFTDSFRNGRINHDATISGAIVHGGKEIFTDAVEANGAQLVLRGLTCRNSKIFVGCSIFAKRDRRFQESGGGVMVLEQGKPALFIPGPFSQAYDVLPLDGCRSDRSETHHNSDELFALFEGNVGPCVYDRAPMRDAAVPGLR